MMLTAVPRRDMTVETLIKEYDAIFVSQLPDDPECQCRMLPPVTLIPQLTWLAQLHLPSLL